MVLKLNSEDLQNITMHPVRKMHVWSKCHCIRQIGRSQKQKCQARCDARGKHQRIFQQFYQYLSWYFFVLIASCGIFALICQWLVKRQTGNLGKERGYDMKQMLLESILGWLRPYSMRYNHLATMATPAVKIFQSGPKLWLNNQLTNIAVYRTMLLAWVKTHSNHRPKHINWIKLDKYGQFGCPWSSKFQIRASVNMRRPCCLFIMNIDSLMHSKCGMYFVYWFSFFTFSHSYII